jgi:hypothetical protein
MKLKTFESLSREIDIEKLSKHYTSERIDISEDIIENIKDILLDLKDIKVELFTYVSYTPFTWALLNKTPEIFVDIQINKIHLIDEDIKLEIEKGYEHIKQYLNTIKDDIEIVKEYKGIRQSDNIEYLVLEIDIKVI